MPGPGNASCGSFTSRLRQLSMSARPVKLSALLLLGTVVAGATVRFAPLGLPRFVVKYGGSTMWALMIYWVVSTLLPSSRISAAAMLAMALATAVEFLKLYHAPAIEAFRHTFAGVILLGQFFSPWDLLAYAVAIAAGALVDRRL
jgi:hypothetical protein